MNFWEYLWGIVILFSILSFAYLSLKVVYKGFAELKEMFKLLEK